MNEKEDISQETANVKTPNSMNASSKPFSKLRYLADFTPSGAFSPLSGETKHYPIYNFVRPDFISAKAQLALTSFFKKYVNPLGFILVHQTGLQAEVRMESVELFNYQEYRRDIENPCIYFECDLSYAAVLGLEIRGLEQGDPHAAEQRALKGPDLSTLARNIITGLFKDKKPEIKEFRFVNDPENITSKNTLEMRLVACYKIKLSERKYTGPQNLTVNLIIPRYALIRMFLKYFSFRDRVQINLSPGKFQDRLNQRTFQISAGSFADHPTKCEIGTNIRLNRKIESPVSLLDRTTGSEIATGELVIVDGHYGIRIDKPTKPLSTGKKDKAATGEIILGNCHLPEEPPGLIKPGAIIKSDRSVYSLLKIQGNPGCTGYLEATQNESAGEEVIHTFRVVRL